MTMGTSWPWKPKDHFKSVGTLVHNLCRIVARGGNYLIGIGPDSHGEFDPIVYDRLKGIGIWLKKNGEAIYSTRPLAPNEQPDCVFTRKKNGTMYAIVQASNDTDGLPESLTLPSQIASRVSKLKIIGGPELHLDEGGTIRFPLAFREKSAGGLAWAIKLTPKK